MKSAYSMISRADIVDRFATVLAKTSLALDLERDVFGVTCPKCVRTVSVPVPTSAPADVSLIEFVSCKHKHDAHAVFWRWRPDVALIVSSSPTQLDAFDWDEDCGSAPIVLHGDMEWTIKSRTTPQEMSDAHVALFCDIVRGREYPFVEDPNSKCVRFTHTELAIATSILCPSRTPWMPRKCRIGSAALVHL